MITNDPSPIRTTLLANITFSDSSNTRLNPVEDLGNLSAELIQSEITAKLSDPKLLGDLFNSVNPPLTGKEGRVITVVAKACHRTIENPALRTSNTLQGIVPVAQSSCSMKKEQKNTFPT